MDERVPVHRDAPACSSRESASEPVKKVVRVSTVFVLISLKTEIARSVRGPKLPGPRAENALAQRYLGQKLLVTC